MLRSRKRLAALVAPVVAASALAFPAVSLAGVTSGSGGAVTIVTSGGGGLL
jgi:hypothetical protein